MLCLDSCWVSQSLPLPTGCEFSFWTRQMLGSAISFFPYHSASWPTPSFSPKSGGSSLGKCNCFLYPKWNTANTLCTQVSRFHSQSQTPVPRFTESDLWFVLCHSSFWWNQMLFVSNSWIPGTMKIPRAHLITIQQSVPVRIFYLQALFLPRTEEAGSVTSVSTVTKVKTGMVHQAFILGKTAYVESPSQMTRENDMMLKPWIMGWNVWNLLFSCMPIP